MSDDPLKKPVCAPTTMSGIHSIEKSSSWDNLSNRSVPSPACHGVSAPDPIDGSNLPTRTKSCRLNMVAASAAPHTLRRRVGWRSPRCGECITRPVRSTTCTAHTVVWGVAQVWWYQPSRRKSSSVAAGVVGKANPLDVVAKRRGGGVLRPFEIPRGLMAVVIAQFIRERICRSFQVICGVDVVVGDADRVRRL